MKISPDRLGIYLADALLQGASHLTEIREYAGCKLPLSFGGGRPPHVSGFVEIDHLSFDSRSSAASLAKLVDHVSILRGPGCGQGGGSVHAVPSPAYVRLHAAMVRPIEGGCQQGLKYRGAAKILVAEALGSYFSASENIKARTAAAAETAAQMAETFLAVRASFASAAARRTL